jgi:CRISPR-associated protein Cmr2
LHAAISEALANFSLHFVPAIVAEHQGTLIYAGGDDVLALLPTSTAIDCAAALQIAYRRDWGSDSKRRERLLVGRRGTVSAGLAIVHHKSDLRFALDTARQAEKAAKKADRDALQIVACRRSGEHSSALCPWSYTRELAGWIQAFLGSGGKPGASDRWAYRLRQELPTLEGLELPAMQSEIKRQLSRADSYTRKLLAGGRGERDAPDMLVNAFDTYRLSERPLKLGENQAPKGRFANDAEALRNFVTLCQTASFLARGRDE